MNGEWLPLVVRLPFLYHMVIGNDIFARVSNELVLSGDSRHLGGWFYKSELLRIMECLNNTLRLYEQEGVTDKYIDNLDNEVLRKEKSLWEKKKTKKKKNDHLYLIVDISNNKLKIGRSINPQKRLKQLQTSNSGLLKLMFIVNDKGYLEEELHDRFKMLRLCGEWFMNDGTIIEYFSNNLL